MKSVGIILTGIISLVLSSGMTLSIAHGATQKTEPRYYDGPCTSAEYTLCKLSEKILSKQAHEALAEKVHSMLSEPKAVKPATIRSASAHAPSAARAPKSPQSAVKMENKESSPIERINLHPFKPNVSEPTSVTDIKNRLWQHYVYVIYDESPSVPLGFHCIPLHKVKPSNDWAQTFAKRLPPGLNEAIPKAESGFRQYDEKTGCVLRGKKHPPDRGAWQINMKDNGPLLRAIGVNCDSLRGNALCAVFLAIDQGLHPWKSSRDVKDGWGPLVPKKQRLPLWKQIKS